MIRVLGAFLVALVVLSLSTSALARTPPVEHPRETIIVFFDVGLEGQVQKPESAWVKGRTPAEFESLIQLRRHFLDELAGSVDEI